MRDHMVGLYDPFKEEILFYMEQVLTEHEKTNMCICRVQYAGTAQSIT